MRRLEAGNSTSYGHACCGGLRRRSCHAADMSSLLQPAPACSSAECTTCWTQHRGHLYRTLCTADPHVQYAFLADRTGGSGLTWAKLSDPGNGMLSVLLICGIEALALMWWAYYLEQVGRGGACSHPLCGSGCARMAAQMLPACLPAQATSRDWRGRVPPVQVWGAGTGIRRHRLFFLGFKYSEAGAAKPRRWGWGRGRAAEGKDAGKQQQAGAGAVQLAATVPAGADDVAAGQLAADESWADAYYGSFSAGAGPLQLGSPHLDTARRNQSQPQLPYPEAAEAQPVVPRKLTSLKLAVAAEPSLHAPVGGGSGREEAEGPDVAAERARVEALWQQW